MSHNITTAEPPKLPLEVIGLILLKLDGNLLQELKKCRLISPRWYKGVQDLFRDELSQKYLTHLNGSETTFAKSRSFGYNIFGNIRLNFPTFKISNSEYYLLKTCLNRMILTNLQNLELQNNQLNWRELIQVLSKFQNIVKLGFCQTYKSSQVAEKMYKLFQIDFKSYDYKKEEELYLKIQNEIGTLDFLPNLKSVEMNLVHVKMSNILAMIVSFSQSKIEEFSVKIDQFGLYKSIENCRDLGYHHELQMNHLEYLKGFEESLKKFEIIVESNLPEILNNSICVSCGRLAYLLKFQLSHNILKVFSRPESLKFQNLQNLRIEAPMYHVRFGQDHLTKFVKNLKNLEQFHISTICDERIYNLDNIENVFNQIMAQRFDSESNDYIGYLETLLAIHPRITFEFQLSNYFIGILENYPERLTKLRLTLHVRTLLEISQDTPTFPNCSELRMEVYIVDPNDWPNFKLSIIAQKFSNLEKLTITTREKFSTEIPLLLARSNAQVIRNDLYDFNLFENYDQMGEMIGDINLNDNNELEFDSISEIGFTQELLDQQGIFPIKTTLYGGELADEFIPQFENQPQITIDDFRIIIKDFKKLKKVHLGNCIRILTDPGVFWIEMEKDEKWSLGAVLYNRTRHDECQEALNEVRNWIITESQDASV